MYVNAYMPAEDQKTGRLAIILHNAESGELGDAGSKVWGACWGGFRVGPKLALLAACSAA